MSEMEDKKFRPVDYDPLVDSLFVSVPDRRYEYSIMIGNDLILDFGRLPGGDKLDVVGFELLDASRKFGVDKYLLKGIKRLHAEITVNEKRVRLVVSLVLVQHRKEKKRSKILEVANSGVPQVASSISV
ncbi:DUF2283 domain-containing protein [Thermococcus indicus]|uniref:DUF2283 domain-containing protein n=1 Tax=Thermococcus indicus TaxID=2586643 RepID=A0A4Y5SM74_9EURY|nr:DUF2283 domain-containing protein [Thermococcus indicus]QDA31875.1 DUF2283 domain-containing protein [Thermococcus indicus]